jgi:hypothetical protein
MGERIPAVPAELVREKDRIVRDRSASFSAFAGRQQSRPTQAAVGRLKR